MDSETVMHVHISRATETLWEGDAVSLSSVNTTGPFDILPMHANFISVVEGHPVTIVKSDNTTQEFAFKQAVIYVRGNVVRIFVNL